MQFNVEHTITRKSQELVKEKFPSVVVNGYKLQLLSSKPLPLLINQLIYGITISKREWQVNRMDRGKHIRKDQKKMII